MAVIECIPNVSEGRRQEVLDACAERDPARRASRLLDVKPDAAHNRAVFTFAGEPAAVKAAVLALFDAALPRDRLADTTAASTRAWAPSTSCPSCPSRA